MNKLVNFLVVITAHNEGFLLHKAIKSVTCGLDYIDSRCNCRHEVIVNLDRGDSITESYLNRCEVNGLNVIVTKTDFGDLGLSRNFAVDKASGEFVFFLDGDDLISENWFYNAISILKQNDSVVVHPEYSITFDGTKKHTVWKQKDSKGTVQDRLLLCGANRWISTCAAKRDVFLQNRYIKSGDGYGNEDWAFNSETESHNIRHVVAKNTVQFYRKKANSMLVSNNAKRRIQPFCDLYSFKEEDFSGSKKSQPEKKTSVKDSLYRKYKKVRESKAEPIITYFARIARDIVFVKKKAKAIVRNLPSEVMDEWKKASRIESQLYPTKDDLNNISFYDSDSTNLVGVSYALAMQNVKSAVDYVFVAPWIVPGGADKVLLNYLKGILEIDSKRKIAVITTLPSKNNWLSMLPKTVYHIDFGNNAKELKDEEKTILMDRIIGQLNCKKLHIINSEFMYKWCAEHEELFNKTIDLYASLFCHDVIPGTNGEGIFDYSDPYLLNIFNFTKKIYTDNRRVVDRMVERCGVSDEKFVVHYQPTELIDHEPKKPYSKKNKMKILWASRLNSQKCPDVLKSIAERINPDEFEIHVFGRSDGYDESFFDGVKSIVFHGKYDGFSSIEPNKFDLYLYTSAIDGLPNTLLEAASYELPIIAPNVGGIGEFILDKKTGLLVEDYRDVEGYISGIEFAKNNYKDMQSYAKNAMKLLVERHSWDSYIKTIKKDFE